MKETKKILLAILVISLMLVSGLSVMAGSASAQSPPVKASNNFNVNPTTFSAGASHTRVYLTGGTFSAGATIQFWVSTSQHADDRFAQVGQVTLNAGTTTLSTPADFHFDSVSEGTYYLLATDDGGASWALGPEIHVVSSAPWIYLWSPYYWFVDEVNVGDNLYVYGGGFDPGATVRVYLSYPGSSDVWTTTTADSDGIIFAPVQIPHMSGTMDNTGSTRLADPYYLVAQETNDYSSDYPAGGITAFTQFDVLPSITVSPISTQGAAGSTFTITGTGFVAGQVMSAFSSTDTGTSSITIDDVNTYHSAVTVSSNGDFTVTVTLADDLSGTSGELPVKLRITNPTITETYHRVLYLSIPGVNPQISISPGSGYPGRYVRLIISGFPASAQVSVYWDSTVIKVTTDQNGFILKYIKVPYIPGGSYHIFAYSQGIAASTTFYVRYHVYIDDSNGYYLDEDYAASGSQVKLKVVGLYAYEEVNFVDDGSYFYPLTLGDMYYYGIPLVSIVKGSFNYGTHNFMADANGTLILSYTIYYDPTHVTTGSPAEITMVWGDGTPVGWWASSTYYKVGLPSVTGFSDSYSPEQTGISLSITNLIPRGEWYTPETSSYYGPFSIYIDNTLIELSSHHTAFWPDSSGSYSAVFNLPSSIGTGIHIFYLESHDGTPLFSHNPFIVSSPSLNSGIIKVNMDNSLIMGGSGGANDPYLGYPGDEIEFDLYNFPAGQHVNIVIYDEDGSHPATIYVDGNGAGVWYFEFPEVPGNIPFLISFSATIGSFEVSITGDTYYYATIPAVSFSEAPFGDNGFVPATDYYDYYSVPAFAGDEIDFYAYDLMPDTVYNVYLSDSSSFTADDMIDYFTTDGYGYAEVEVQLPPTLETGTYYLDIAPASSSATSTDLYLTVEVIQAAPLYAFPGQVVNVGPIEVDPPENLAYYIVTINLNGTAYKTLDVVPTESGGNYYLSFSFQMPNGNPGNYWYIGYNITPVVVNTIQESIPASAVATSISPDTYDISTSYPESTYSEYGEATFTLPDGYEVDTSAPITLAFELEPGTGMGSSAAVSVVAYNIVGATQSGNTLTVKYVVTFTLTGFHVNPAVVNVVSVKASFSGTAYDQESTGTPITITAPDTYTSDSVTGTATFDIPSGVSVSSVSAFSVPITSASGGTADWVGFSSTATIGTSQITVDYSGQIQISHWTTAPVTVNVGTPTLHYVGTYTATTDIAVAPDSIHSDGTGSQTVHLAVAVTIPSGMTVDDVTSVTITLNGATSGPITPDSTTVDSWSVSGTVVSIYVTVEYTDNNDEDIDVGVSQVQLSVSGSLTGSASPTSYELHPTYTDSASGSASVPLSPGYTITHIDSTEPSTTPDSVFTDLTYSPGPISGSTIPYDIDYELTDFVAGEDYEVPLPEFDFDFHADNIEGTPSPSSYTEVFSGTFTMQGTAAFDVGTNGVAAIDNFALDMSSPDPNSYVNETGLVVNHWYVDGSTLYVEYSVTFSVYNTLTVNVDSAKVSYHYIDTTTTQSVDTADAINAEMTYPITLVQGNGAYIMGITDEQIARIIAAVNSTITASMEVPLAQLNASVEAINDAVAQINTAFGTMYATLDAINATVTAIYDGMATVQTDIGTIKTALLNLNATVEGIAGDVVIIKTAVGDIKATLDQLNATLVGINNGMAELSTAVGEMKVSVDTLNATIAGISDTIVEIHTEVGDIKATLDQLNATLVSINNGIMDIKTSLGDIQASVSDLNAKVDSISGDVVTIKTDVGSIKASVSNLDAKITSLQGDVATIQTTLGTVQVKLDAINATVTSNANGISDLKGSVVEIQTTLGTIKGTVTNIKDGVATIQTDLGTVKTDVGKIKTNTGNTANSVNTTLYWEIGVLILVIITLALVAYVIVQVNKIARKSEVKEEKVEESEEE